MLSRSVETTGALGTGWHRALNGRYFEILLHIKKYRAGRQFSHQLLIDEFWILIKHQKELRI